MVVHHASTAAFFLLPNRMNLISKRRLGWGCLTNDLQVQPTLQMRLILKSKVVNATSCNVSTTIERENNLNLWLNLNDMYLKRELASVLDLIYLSYDLDFLADWAKAADARQ